MTDIEQPYGEGIGRILQGLFSQQGAGYLDTRTFSNEAERSEERMNCYYISLDRASHGGTMIICCRRCGPFLDVGHRETLFDLIYEISWHDEHSHPVPPTHTISQREVPE